MKVLVTGTEGYLGCLLAPELIRDGHEVIGVDTGFYKQGWLYNGLDTTPLTFDKDIRQLTAEDLEGVDADRAHGRAVQRPARPAVADITYEINHQGSVRLAELAKQAGVSGSSTCRPAASTASPTARSTRPRRSTRRPRTPSARRWSSGT